MLGALLGVAAVALAQLGRPVGGLAVGALLLAVAGGLAVALQSALNGRVAQAGGSTAGIAVNFAVGTPAIVAVAALAGSFTGPAPSWPGDWYLYAGGALGVAIVLALMVGVRAVGVLRTGLALVAGQLGGALLLDVALPGGAGLRLPVLAGAALTLVAVLVAGRGTRRPAAPPPPGAPPPPAAPPPPGAPSSTAPARGRPVDARSTRCRRGWLPRCRRHGVVRRGRLPRCRRLGVVRRGSTPCR
ncbi:DMT family transporter [Micromonospora sp. NPDC048830]|uniref:DMT family transporter n=1 Tax=Micromonospora sp. NPDC048830 TaxID=3364257 RepID=UPI003712AAF0